MMQMVVMERVHEEAISKDLASRSQIALDGDG
jgi:hypothetical protein